jgi:hypothetical protein
LVVSLCCCVSLLCLLHYLLLSSMPEVSDLEGGVGSLYKGYRSKVQVVYEGSNLDYLLSAPVGC